MQKITYEGKTDNTHVVLRNLGMDDQSGGETNYQISGPLTNSKPMQPSSCSQGNEDQIVSFHSTNGNHYTTVSSKDKP